jgi:hypothetical protein
MSITRALFSIGLLCVGPLALAQIVTSKGTVSVTYEKKLTPEIKAKAFHDAEVNALERHVAESGSFNSEAFEAIRAKVSASIESYVLGASVVSEETHPDTHQYSVVVHVDINDARLNNELKNNTVVANTASTQKSPLTFVFVARGQAAIKSFDAHSYKRVDSSVAASNSSDQAKSGTEGESIKSSQISTNASASARGATQSSTSSTAEIGGSTTRQADQVTWTLIPAASINTIVTGIFSAAAFEVVEAEYVEPQSKGFLSLKALQEDYKSGNDLQPQTLRNTVQGLQSAQIPYLALATLDVGFPDTDPGTGLTRVYVTVTGKVLDVTGRFPRTLASVGPEQFAGIGPSTDVAQTNALKIAADKAARELVSQINSVGVH